MKHSPEALPLLLFALFLASCESEEMKTLKVRHESVSRNVESYRDRVSKAAKKLEKLKPELVEATEDAEAALKSIASAEASEREVHESIKKFEESDFTLRQRVSLLEAYQKAFIEKTVPNGTPLGDLILTDGSTYTQAVFMGVTNGNVRFSHSAGIFHCPLSTFPESVQNRLSVRPVSHSSDSFLAVLDKKPASLLSSGDYAEAQQRAAVRAERESKEREAERQRLNAEQEAERRRLGAEREKMEQESARKEEVRRQALAEIDSKLELLDQQLRQIESRHARAISEARGRAIPMSAKDMQSIEDSFEGSKRALRQQISQLQMERNQVRNR